MKQTSRDEQEGVGQSRSTTPLLYSRNSMTLDKSPCTRSPRNNVSSRDNIDSSATYGRGKKRTIHISTSSFDREFPSLEKRLTQSGGTQEATQEATHNLIHRGSPRLAVLCPT